MCLLLFKMNCNARQNKSVIFDLEHSAIDLELQMLTHEGQARQKGPSEASGSVPTTYEQVISSIEEVKAENSDKVHIPPQL